MSEALSPQVTRAGVAVGVAATAGSVAVAVYALGSARGWWQGSSCTLAACGADDIAWAWYVVAAVGAGITVLMILWLRQVTRDARRPVPQ